MRNLRIAIDVALVLIGGLVLLCAIVANPDLIDETN